MTQTSDRVSVADVFQAIQGTKFPATREDLMAAVQDKYNSELFSDERLNAIMTFIEECDEDLIRNTAKLAETVKDWNSKSQDRKFKDYRAGKLRRHSRTN